MTKTCKYCEKEIEYQNGKQFGAHLTNCKSNPSKLKRDVKKSKEYIKKNYSFEEDEIEAHFHYPPTVLLLHIHFVLVNNRKFRKPIIEHSVNSVMQNLSIDPYYYKKIKIEILKKL